MTHSWLAIKVIYDKIIKYNSILFNNFHKSATSSTTPQAPTTLSPSDAQTAKTTLQILQATAAALKTDIEAFGGNPALVESFLAQDVALLAKIDQLTQQIPSITTVEISAVFNELSALKGSYNSFLASYQGRI